MRTADEPAERAQKESAGACGGSKLFTDESVFGVITHRAAAFSSLSLPVLCVCVCERERERERERVCVCVYIGFND